MSRRTVTKDSCEEPQNGIEATLLLGTLSAILILGIRTIAGEEGLTYGLIPAVGMNFFSYFFYEKIALISAQPQPLSRTQHPQVFAPIVGDLSRRMGIPMPKLWVTPESSLNLFAAGRNPNHASVAVTAGILQLMSDEELAAVLVHELGT